MFQPLHSSRSLRAELSARHTSRTAQGPYELTVGRTPSVIYGFGDGEGEHGNFLRPALRRILANPGWARRLEKAYTGVHQLPRAGDRRRGELECAASSDALLMNLFCYPGVLRRPGLCAYLAVKPGLQPAFGVRVALPMERGEVDRTELDMRLADLLVEAKLTETGFGRATSERLLRYERVEELFELDRLPRQGQHFAGYQLIRGMLAAERHGMRYLVLLDRRRADLQELCFQVLRAVRHVETRGRFRLLTWQELAGAFPPVLRAYLAERFGVEAT